MGAHLDALEHVCTLDDVAKNDVLAVEPVVSDHSVSPHQSVTAVHRKNCDPLVFRPELAIDRVPAVRGTTRKYRGQCG
jgi:hypothetical protein